MKYIGEALRIQKKVTLEELAIKAKIPVKDLQEFESGKKTIISSKQLLCIANELNVDILELFL